MRTPRDSAIAFTMKFGALPIYVFAPMKTAPAEMAASVVASVVMSVCASPPARLKNTR